MSVSRASHAALCEGCTSPSDLATPRRRQPINEAAMSQQLQHQGKREQPARERETRATDMHQWIMYPSEHLDLRGSCVAQSTRPEAAGLVGMLVASASRVARRASFRLKSERFSSELALLILRVPRIHSSPPCVHTGMLRVASCVLGACACPPARGRWAASTRRQQRRPRSSRLDSRTDCARQAPSSIGQRATACTS